MTRLVVLDFLRLPWLLWDLMKKAFMYQYIKILHTVLRGYPQVCDNFSENTDNISENWVSNDRRKLEKLFIRQMNFTKLIYI